MVGSSLLSFSMMSRSGEKGTGSALHHLLGFMVFCGVMSSPWKATHSLCSAFGMLDTQVLPRYSLNLSIWMVVRMTLALFSGSRRDSRVGIVLQMLV